MTLKNGLLLGVVLGSMSLMLQPAAAAEIKVLTTGAFKQVVVALVPEFEKATGHKLTVRFAATPELIKMATSGDPLDVAVVPREVFLDATAKTRFVLEASADIARVGFGVGIRAGAPNKPDIATADSFRQALLDAKSIATLPTSAAGAIVLKTFERLGIGEAMKAKIKAQTSPGDIPRALISGDAELGVFLQNVLSVPGVDIVGPFPPDLQQEFVFRSAIATGTGNALAGKAFIDFLRSPAAQTIIKSQGLTPG
jgi:molybdate transport system substrate-binding protein